MGRSDKNFEDQWRDIFSGSEVAPNDKVWNNIQLSLSESQNAVYAQKIKRTRWLAAAAISFAVTAGIAGYYYGNKSQDKGQSTLALIEEPLLNSDNSKESVPENKSLPNDKIDNSIVANDDKAQLHNPTSTESTSKANELNSVSDKINNNGDGFSNAKRNKAFVTTQNTESKNNAFSLKEEGESNGIIEKHLDENSTQLLDNAFLISKIESKDIILSAGLDKITLENFPYARPIMKNSIDDDSGNYWGGISLAGGNYNPEGFTVSNNNSLDKSVYSLAPDMENAQIVNYYSTKIPGSSRLIALNVGKRMGKRWTINSGISLDNFVSGLEVSQSDYSQFARIQDADLASFQNPQMNDVYVQQNTLNYITIPLQVGYYLIDKKLGWAITFGVNSSALIGFKEERISDNYLSFNIDEQENNNLLFWYLVGTELNYDLGGNYVVALAPGYRMALNSLESNSEKRATSAELGFRLRYNF